jgi:hypothetical protein
MKMYQLWKGYLHQCHITRDLTQVSLAISKFKKPHDSCEENYNKTKTSVTHLKK